MPTKFMVIRLWETNYFFRSNLQVHSKLNLSLYAQLAETIVFDLSLNKPKPKTDQLVLCAPSQTYYKPLPRSIEERRAVLGCFLITSMYNSHFPRKLFYKFPN
jgi:hypothetical protein